MASVTQVYRYIKRMHPMKFLYFKFALMLMQFSLFVGASAVFSRATHNCSETSIYTIFWMLLFSHSFYMYEEVHNLLYEKQGYLFLLSLFFFNNVFSIGLYIYVWIFIITNSICSQDTPILYYWLIVE